MEHGFSQSGIRLNQDIAKKDKWTLAELEERDSALTQQALKIWARPVTDYKPAEKQLIPIPSMMMPKHSVAA